jgi:hypothetical protein
MLCDRAERYFSTRLFTDDAPTTISKKKKSSKQLGKRSK